MAAGRIFLREIGRNIAARRDFGFETTLSGRAHLRVVRRLKADGWCVELIYLALPFVEVAELRVAERVRRGGHDIPLPDIERRFVWSLDRLFDDYVTLVDHTVCFFNVDPTPRLVFTQEGAHRVVTEPSILRMLEDKRRHGSTR